MPTMLIKINMIILLIIGFSFNMSCFASERKHPLESLDFHKIKSERAKPKPKDLAFLDVYDPLESTNRSLYKFNRQFDEAIYLPVVSGYRYLIPTFIRSRISSMFNNVSEVSNVINNGLQLKGKGILNSAGRLLINTTVGLFGLFDPASYFGLEQYDEDFGQTLAFYGVGDGAYVVVPILGPSNLRDITGLLVDSVSLNYINWLNIPHTTSKHWELFTLQVVDVRYQIPFRYGSMDSPFEYDMVRYLYKQARELKVEVKALDDENQ